ncbi:hypothetical protein V6183_21975, partial [Enterobacter hormaechei]|uniref:hypothetical protein n=1 Tax=Enterobacter hormaechei TaxID=158836 RepID=UPI003B841FAB
IPSLTSCNDTELTLRVSFRPQPEPTPSEYEDKTGMLIRHYYVDCHPYYDRLPPEKSDNFQYDEYPSAIHVAACIDQASKELDELLFGGGYGENGEGHASPIILY